mgnify:FL=1
MSTKKAAKRKKSSGIVDLETKYWHRLLTHGQRPASVYAFAQEIGIAEADFYKHVSTFGALEAAYWKRLVTETIAILKKDDDYAAYSPEQKLLAFYFTFFTHAQKNRSRMVEFFPESSQSKSLQPMRHAFKEFAEDLIKEGVESGLIADRKKLTERYPSLLFEQFRQIIGFYRKDQSDEFQDTDALIEKTVRFSADVASSGTLDSAFDLGRFLLRRFTITKF